MIRIKLKELKLQKERDTNKRITWIEISKKTGISTGILTRACNDPSYNLSIDTLDKLCDYFNVSPGDILEKIKD